jgi:hypothetical protein
MITHIKDSLIEIKDFILDILALDVSMVFFFLLKVIMAAAVGAVGTYLLVHSPLVFIGITAFLILLFMLKKY